MAQRKPGACRTCGKPLGTARGPLCQACRDRDLLAWLGDSYRVPGPPVEEEAGLDSEGDAPL